MIIPWGFDESNESRRKKEFADRMRTAEKLKTRINHFFKEIDNNHSLTKGQKNQIKAVLTPPQEDNT